MSTRGLAGSDAAAAAAVAAASGGDSDVLVQPMALALSALSAVRPPGRAWPVAGRLVEGWVREGCRLVASEGARASLEQAARALL